MATHKDSRRQEKRTAKKTGCKVHSGSGNKQVKDDMSLDGGDEVNRIRIETKITSNSEFRVPLRDFEETARRAGRARGRDDAESSLPPAGHESRR